MMQNAKKVIIIEKMTEQKTPERIKKNQLSSHTPHKKAGSLEWSENVCFPQTPYPHLSLALFLCILQGTFVLVQRLLKLRY